jgi:polyhydroxybutyrate depolymerase
MMRAGMRVRVILGLSAAMVVACTARSATIAPAGSAPAIGSSSPSAPSAAGQTVSPAASRADDVLVGGDRPVTVQVPAGYDPDRPAPLLIVLHGYGSSGQDHDAYFHLGQTAEQRGFLYAYPDGTFDGGGNRFWNATDACCDFDHTGVADAAYLADVITEIRGSFAVDPKRVYLIGHSNGGFMSYAMACAHADLIAAMVSLAGATFANPAKCAPTVPVAVLEIHGTADDTILFKGGTIKGLGSGRSMASYPGAETSVATWAKYDGCATSSVVDEHVDVDADLGGADAPAEASVTRWTGCRPGGAVELWTMPGGGHAPNISDSFPLFVLDFVEAHPKP